MGRFRRRYFVLQGSAVAYYKRDPSQGVVAPISRIELTTRSSVEMLSDTRCVCVCVCVKGWVGHTACV